MSIGKRILELRTKAGLTQLELAERLYVTDKAVSKWERDGGEPNTQALIEMGKIFSVSIDYLLTGESKEKLVIMSETEKIAFDDDVEKAKKYPYEIETGIDVSGLSLRDYIYKHRSKKLFNHFIRSSQAKSLLGDQRGERYKYLNEFALMCFENEIYSVFEGNAIIKLSLSEIYFKDQLPEREHKFKPIINDSIVDYIINNEKVLNFIMKDQDIYWHNGLSKVLEKLVKDNNPLSDKVYKFVEKKNNEAKKYQESQYNSYYRSNDYWLKNDGVYHKQSNMLVKSITPVTRETIIYALNHNNYELAEKLNELSGGLVSDHEFKMDKVSKDNKMSKKDKLKESVIIDGLVDIDKLIALDDYKLYKEVIEQPASKEKAALQLAEKKKYRELLLIAEEEKLSYTKEAIIRDRITTLKDAIINDFRGKRSDFNKKYLGKEHSYNSKLLGKNCILFKDIIKHKDYDFFRHAANTNKENLDWALEEIVKDRHKEYELIKLLLDEGAKLHSRWTEDDGWGYMVQRDEIDDVATQLLRNQIEIFLKEEKIMTKEQQLILGNEVGFIFMPFTFKDAIEKYCSYNYKPEELKSLATMGKFWSFIDSKYKKAVFIQDNKMEIIQPKDVKEGTLTFVNFGIESIEVNYKSGKKTIKLEKSIFKQYMVGNIEVKFNDPFDHIVLNFNNNIADPLHVKADFKLYVEPIKDEKEELIDMNATHRTGEDLVNIYFQKVSDKVNRVEVELYIVDNKNENQLIGTYQVQDNLCFMSITGLAFGKYGYSVIQYQSSKKMASSNIETFYISRPNYGGKPSISNR